MKIKDLEVKANELRQGIVDLNKQAEEWMKETLAKCPNNYVEVGGLDDDGDYDQMCVPYDGGNHPEYDSNAFSTIEGIGLNKNGEIFLDTEDATHYPLDYAQSAGGGLLTYEVAEFMSQFVDDED